MKDFVEFIKFIRKNIIEQPGDDYEGDDLSIDIYNGELAIQINRLYDGPTVIYSPNSTQELTITFDEKTAEYDGDSVIAIAKIAELIKSNVDIINEIIL